MNLLLRFYEPQRGRILSTAWRSAALPLDVLRAVIGLRAAGHLPLCRRCREQHPPRRSALDRTALDLARGPGGGGPRRSRGCRAAGARACGARYAGVSVGERQLLAFARAVAADPALLVLDEATSAVDSEIEADIQRAVATLMQGRTTIAIAHRLSTIADADQILVLHHGAVVERGAHRQLLAAGGLYERLFRLESGNVGRHAPGAGERSRLPTPATSA